MILPTPSEAFHWITTPSGPALVCEPLLDIAAHVFTTRAWRLGQDAQARDDESAWAEVTRAVGAADLARLRQVHGSRVVLGDDAVRACPEADALIGREPTRALAVQAADCVPLLMADRRTGAVAAVHAGWRGLVQQAPAAAVSALINAFGAGPADLVVAIGPSIGPCCYEVGPDVLDQFARQGVDRPTIDRWFARQPRASTNNPPMRREPSGPDKRFLDLWAVTVDGLVRAGVAREHVVLSEICTASHPDSLCSFRRDGSAAGRIVAAIRPTQ